MGTRFDTWLSRPHTICFLRRVLNTAGHAPSNVTCRRRALNAGALDRDSLGAEDNGTPRRRRYYRSEHTADSEATAAQKREEATEIALRISLGPDVPLVAAHVEPGKTFTTLSTGLNVCSSSTELVKRLGESPKHRTDMKLWAELLQSRHRHDGLAGVMAVWNGMRQHVIDLATEGNEADILWTTFITSGVFKKSNSVPNKLFTEVLQYAARLKDRTGAFYPRLYQTVIAIWLQAYPAYVPKWHQHLAEHIGEECIDVSALAGDYAMSDAFKPFKVIYLREKKRQRLYDHFIPELLRVLGVERTLRWHKLFIADGDGPGAEVFAMPLVQQLFDLDDDRSLPMIHRRFTDDKDFVGPKDGMSLEFPSLTRATMSKLVGEVHGIKQREVSDSFIAKMFATRAFPIDMVISGLGIIGVQKVGPLALREMGLRARSASDFNNKLSILRRMGIEVSEAIYCRLLTKLAQDGSSGLYDALLASDQHPEAFEDIKTQEVLLESFLRKGELSSAQITLTGLALQGGSAHDKAWNIIIQHYIKEHEYILISTTMQQMQALEIILTVRTLAFMNRYLLPQRNQGKAPREAILDQYLGVPPLQFTTNAYKYAAEHGVYVKPQLWIEITKRYGMMQQWDELERLVYWLATFYHDWTRVVSKNTRRSGRRVRANETLKTLFSSSMRDALIVWGFRSAVKKKLLSEADPSPTDNCQPWARGVLLLRKLNEKGLHNYGMQTSTALVRRVVKLRMWILFGPAFSTKRINVEANKHNELSLAHYIQHANTIWDGELFDLDPELYEPENHPKLLVALFGRKARVKQKSGDRADVAAYARALAERRPMPRPFHCSGYRRQRLWETSPFRIPPANPRPAARPGTAIADPPTWRSRRQRQSPSARSSSSRPVPNHQGIPEAA